MNILLVEDEAEKARVLAELLAKVSSVNPDLIERVADLNAARRSLIAKAYDLLLLDIAVPQRPDRAPDPRGGVKLLEELRQSATLHAPTHVIGVTGYPEIYDAVREQFAGRMISVLYCDPADEAWEGRLVARVEDIARASHDHIEVDADYQSKLVVVCALDDPELESVLRLDWDWQGVTVPNDHGLYWRGRASTSNGEALVYAAAAGRMGMVPSAVLTLNMISAFRPEYVAMVGIAAGVRDRVQMGDVLVADPSWDWGAGKWVLNAGGLEFEPAPRQIPLSVDVLRKLRTISTDRATLGEIRSAWQGDAPRHDPQIRIGPVASGAAVLADGRTMESVLQQQRELLGVDMEIYGVYAAASECCPPRPTVLSLKSVVDHGDPEKDDRYRKYAAYVSARVLACLIERHL